MKCPMCESENIVKTEENPSYVQLGCKACGHLWTPSEVDENIPEGRWLKFKNEISKDFDKGSEVYG